MNNIKSVQFNLMILINAIISIGGQVHVQCAIHELPLIASTDRSSKCSKCGRPEFMQCCEFSCNVLYKRHFRDKFQSTPIYIIPASQSTEDKESDTDSDIDDDSDLREPANQNLVDDKEDVHDSNMDPGTEEADDNMDDLVLSSLVQDVDITEEDDIGNEKFCRATWDEKIWNI
eukprot:4220149-Ditylum_brightwellii.AAC.1